MADGADGRERGARRGGGRARRLAIASRLSVVASLSALASVSVLASLSGCTTQAKMRQSDLTELLGWLPGHYESASRQVALDVVRVFTPRLGHYVLYAHEAAANDPTRLMSQKMLSFKADDERGLVTTVYTFVDPTRWRGSLETPDILTVVLKDDVKSVPGCEVLWRKGAERYSGAPDPAHCHSAAEPGSAIEVTPDTLIADNIEFRKVR